MNFALITEGISEHRIIKHIVSKYLCDYTIFVNQIQPQILNDKQETDGGWNEVLQYCKKDDLESILIENDFLIIQIDSDQSQTDPFSINHIDDEGKIKTSAVLHIDILNKLCSLIRSDIYSNYKDKIIFAICIHTIECWLLPLYYTDNKKSKITNCVETLNRALGKKNMGSINSTSKNSTNSTKVYLEVLKSLKRKKDIEYISKFNPGFQHFVSELEKIFQILINTP